jgi:hypothetical protein
VPVTLVVDRRKALHERLAPRVLPFIGRINRATGRPYTRAEAAAELGLTVHVMYLAWRLAKRSAAPEQPCRCRSLAAAGVVELKPSSASVTGTPVAAPAA